MIRGDFVRILHGGPRMVVTDVLGGFAVVEDLKGFKALAEPASLIPAPYKVRHGVIYDGDIPVGLV